MVTTSSVPGLPDFPASHGALTARNKNHVLGADKTTFNESEVIVADHGLPTTDCTKSLKPNSTASINDVLPFPRANPIGLLSRAVLKASVAA